MNVANLHDERIRQIRAYYLGRPRLKFAGLDFDYGEFVLKTVVSSFFGALFLWAFGKP